MNKFLVLLFILFTLGACSGDDFTQNNPNLLDINVSFSIDKTLPQYSDLNFPTNPVYISNYGNGGIVVMNTGSGYVAWDAIDPNHTRNDNCTSMSLSGTRLECSCEGNTYELFSGNFLESDSEEELQYTLYAYRVTETSSSTLTVSSY